MENISKVAGHLFIALLAVLAPIKAVFITTACLVAADLVLGVLAARKRGEPVTSAGLRRTVSKLFVYEVAVVLGFVCEAYLTGVSLPVSKIISAYIGLTELKSIIENLNTINGSSLFDGLIAKLGSENDKSPQ